MGVRVRLDNSISGFIPTKMISDKHVTNPEDRVKVSPQIYLSSVFCMNCGKIVYVNSWKCSRI